MKKLEGYTIEKVGATQAGFILDVTKGSVKYRVKLHEKGQAPKPPDGGGDPARLEGLRRKYNAKKAICDSFFNYKRKVYERINALHCPTLKCPTYWWQEVLDSDDKKMATHKGTLRCAEAVEYSIVAVATSDAHSHDMIPKFTELSLEDQKEVLLGFVKALAILHEAKVIHSDIKPQNVLIVRNGGRFSGCFIDFDYAFMYDDLPPLDEAMRNMCLGGGTIGYFAPEVQSSLIRSDDLTDEVREAIAKHTPAADVFSLGVTFYELLQGLGTRVPNNGSEEYRTDITLAVQKGFKPTVDSVNNAIFAGMIGWMLEAKPEDRPTAQQLVELLTTFTDELLPVVHRRIDASSPWPEHNIAFSEDLGGAVITKNLKVYEKYGTMAYKLEQGASQTYVTKEDLIRKGFAIDIKAPKSNTAPWGKDEIYLISKLNCVIAVTENESEYNVMDGVVQKTLSLAQLLGGGYAVKESSLCTTPYTEDKIIFNEGFTLYRERESRSEPKKKRYFRLLNADEGYPSRWLQLIPSCSVLIEKGMATRKRTKMFEPWDTDPIIFTPAGNTLIVRAMRKGEGWYIALNSRFARLGKAGILVKQGFASKDAKMQPNNAEERFWPCDEGLSQKDFSVTVSKTRKEGLYSVVRPSGSMQVMDGAGLVKNGICVRGEVANPLANYTISSWEGQPFREVSEVLPLLLPDSVIATANINSFDELITFLYNNDITKL